MSNGDQIDELVKARLCHIIKGTPIDELVKMLTPGIERALLKGDPYLVCMMNDLRREERDKGFITIGELGDNVVKLR